ncbi:MAG: hypothetical protein JST74_10975 [Bacteroidetes bacterium]|nr:hypothetical protein [Bacteroidota bacterium]
MTIPELSSLVEITSTFGVKTSSLTLAEIFFAYPLPLGKVSGSCCFLLYPEGKKAGTAFLTCLLLRQVGQPQFGLPNRFEFSPHIVIL